MRYTAEILPYHDFDFETAIRELAGLGFKEVNLWSSASPLAHHVNPGDDPGKITAILDKYKMKPSTKVIHCGNYVLYAEWLFRTVRALRLLQLIYH